MPLSLAAGTPLFGVAEEQVHRESAWSRSFAFPGGISPPCIISVSGILV